MKSSVDFWFKIHNPRISNLSPEVCKWLDKINRLGIGPVAPMLMTYFKIEKNIKKRLRFLIALERVLFIFVIDQYDRSIINWLSSAIKLNKGAVTADETLKKMESFSAKPIQQKERREYVYKNFGENGFYRWNGIRYFLYEYDLYLQEQSKTHRSKLDWETFNSRDYKSVEHIYPQNGRKACWVDKFNQLSTKERKQVKNSLGNLLPLSQPKNSSFQNKCFIEKVGNNTNTIGFKYGCYAEIEVANNSNWGYNEIRNRGLSLLSFMEERWNIQLGNDQEKLKMLGLSSIEKKVMIKQKNKPSPPQAPNPTQHDT